MIQWSGRVPLGWIPRVSPQPPNLIFLKQMSAASFLSSGQREQIFLYSSAQSKDRSQGGPSGWVSPTLDSVQSLPHIYFRSGLHMLLGEKKTYCRN